jgi:hypothetical protein
LYICGMPASVNVVYNTLKDLVNKDQQGFVTVDEFNRFAQVAQLRIFNRLFDTLKDGSRLERAGFGQGRDKSKFKQIHEDLAIFAKSKDVSKTSGVYARPADFARLISIATAGDLLLGQTTRTPVEICYDEEKIERILSSTLNAPTESFPVALITGDIEVFPESIQKVKMRYYKIPESFETDGTTRSDSPPTFGVLTGSSIDQYDSANSFDFELPEHYTMDLVREIASLIGVNLRDGDVAAFAEKEQLERKTEQSF